MSRKSLILIACLVLAAFGLAVAFGAARPVAPVPAAYLTVTPRGDDTSAVQAALDAVSRPGATTGTVYLPAGTWRINKTLVLRRASGVTVRGSGRLQADPRATGAFGPVTVLVWTGEGDGTLFRGEGVSALTIENLTLIGRPKVDSPSRAGILIHCADAPGFGPAQWTLDRVSFFDADVGVQFGTGVGDGNCADVRSLACTWDRCGSAYRTMNDQSVNHWLESPAFLNCGIALDLERGGNLHVGGAGGTFNCGWILRSGPGGPNNAAMSIANLRVEGDARFQLGAWRRLRLLDCQMAIPGQWQAEVDVTSSLDVRGGLLIRESAAGQ